MVALHPQFITDGNGNKLSAVIPIQKYEALLEQMDMEEDIRLFDEGMADEGPTLSAEEVYAQIDASRKTA